MTAHAEPQAVAADPGKEPVGRGVNPADWWIIGLLLAFFTLNFADKAAIGLAAPDLKRDLGVLPC
ncbi:hypothetical protein JGS39_15960, partial [Streptomyces sp. P01-B04]|nr:hypothetical protein [Streptomyces poriferorum]